MIRGIDWGAYTGPSHEINIPFKTLLDNGLCDFFVCKGAMNSPADYVNSVQNIEAARTAGVPVVGSYYWHFPTYSAQYQIDMYSAAINLEKPDFIALDMELGYGKSSLAISENAKFLMNGLKTNFPNLPMTIYTSANYINVTTPDSNSWIGNYDPWIASWPDYGVAHDNATRHMSYDQLKTYPLASWVPAMPNAWKNKPYTFWQYSTWPIPSGLSVLYDHQYDWNVFNGTLDQLKAWAKLSTSTVPSGTWTITITGSGPVPVVNVKTS